MMQPKQIKVHVIYSSLFSQPIGINWNFDEKYHCYTSKYMSNEQDKCGIRIVLNVKILKKE